MAAAAENSLHLYDRRPTKIADRKAAPTPVHAFGGHQQRPKEFLWRTRGGISPDSADHRDFQLVSWGLDKQLRLHRVTPETLAKIGFERGQSYSGLGKFPETGASYESFRKQDAPEDKAIAQTWQARNVSNYSSIYTPAKLDDPANWMRRVRFERHEENSSSWKERHDLVTNRNAFIDTHNFGEEIAFVDGKYAEAKFTSIDLRRRRVEMEMKGPWGEDKQTVDVKTTLDFPESYPDDAAPLCKIEGLSISAAGRKEASYALDTLANYFTQRHKSCLEVFVLVLLGQRSLASLLSDIQRQEDENETQHVLEQSTNNLDFPARAESDDDDDDDDDFDEALLTNFTLETTTDLDTSVTDIAHPTSANVPLPRTCAAVWTATGQLALFYNPIPKTEPEGDEPDFRNLVEEAFQNSTKTAERLDESLSLASQESSSPLSRSPIEVEMVLGDKDLNKWNPIVSRRDGRLPHYYQTADDHNHETTTRSTHSNLVRISSTESVKTIIRIVDADEFKDVLPARYVLAKGYKLGLDAEEACRHNACICKEQGYLQHAHDWESARLILAKEVPLNASGRPGDIHYSVAKRNLVQVSKKNAEGKDALEFEFDDPPNVTNPAIQGAVKWGGNPLGRKIVNDMLERYVKQQDVQMLAMLTCVFDIAQVDYAWDSDEAVGTESTRDDDPDSEEEEFRAALAPTSNVRVTYENQDKFDDDNAPPVPLLDPKDKTRHLNWRRQYGNQLNSWGLDFHWAEVNSFNKGLLALLGDTFKANLEKVPGTILQCQFCWTKIVGIATICTKCGHAMHHSCHERWAEEGGDFLCTAVDCGCRCTRG